MAEVTIETTEKPRSDKTARWGDAGVRVLAKRMDPVRFTWPATATGEPRKLTPEPSALTRLLDGIELESGAQKPGMDTEKILNFLYP